VNKVRMLVFAYSDVGYHCLRLLLERGEEVVACYTYSDEVPGAAWPPSVEALCREHDVPVRKDTDWKDPSEALRARALFPELIFSFYYRDLLPEDLVRLPRLGAYNMHGSLLPKYRGRAPVNWAVLEGETETGATLHVMTREADAGDIVDQESVPIGPDETAFDVQQEVVLAAVKILSRQIEAIKSGTAPRRPQDPARAFSRGRRRPEDGEINWNLPAASVHNLVRAVSHPYPGAFTDAFGGKTFLWKTRLPGLAAHDYFPGRVYVEGQRLFVCCGDDHFLEVLSLQNEGGREMTAAEWIARQQGKA
jgi:methionyl-tRNA formyltransferase